MSDIYSDIRKIRSRLDNSNKSKSYDIENETDITHILSDILSEMKKLNKQLSKITIVNDNISKTEISERKQEKIDTEYIPDFDFSDGKIRAKKKTKEL